MKKLLLLTVCISSVLCAHSQGVDFVVSLGDNSFPYVGPVYTTYEYSYYQTIYIADQIGASGDIDSVCYFAADTNLDISNSNEWVVLLGHTTVPVAYATSWSTDMDTVFSGTVYLVNDSVCVPFDEPFNYNGTDNLLVAALDNKPGKDVNIKQFKGSINYSSSPTNSSRNSVNDYLTYHPYYTYGGSSGYYYPDIAIYGIAPTCPKSSNLSVSGVTVTSAVLNWDGNAPEYEIDYGLSSLALGSATIATSTVASFDLSSLTENTEYRFYVREICGAGDTSQWTGPITFSTQCENYSVPTIEEPFNQVPPPCWREAQGLLTDSTTFISQDATWSPASFGNNYTLSSSARVSIFPYIFYPYYNSSNVKEW